MENPNRRRGAKRRARQELLLSGKKLERVRRRLVELGVDYGFDRKTARQLARVSL